MRLKLILIFFLGNIYWGFSQSEYYDPSIFTFDHCVVAPTGDILLSTGCVQNTSSSTYQYYYNPANNVPNNNTAIKTILVNFIVHQKSDDTGNFQNNSNDIARLQQIFNWMKGSYENCAEPSDYPYNSSCGSCGGGSCSLQRDSRIRFELNGIFFYQSGLQGCESAGSLENYLATNDPEKLNQLNVFFISGAYTNIIKIVNGGSNYEYWPSIKVPIPGFTKAEATAVVSNGQVTSVTINNAGLGYPSPPDIFFANGGGRYAAATAVLDANGSITSINVTDNGIEYSSSPEVIIQHNKKREAILVPVVTNGQITNCQLFYPGEGYDSTPTCVINGGGSGASISVSVNSNKNVTSPSVLNSGSGYPSIPVVSGAVSGMSNNNIHPVVDGSGVITEIQIRPNIVPASNLSCNGTQATLTLSNTNGSGLSVNIIGSYNTPGAGAANADMPSLYDPIQSIRMMNPYRVGRSEGDYGFARTLEHEIGHCFGLPHTYVGGGASANCTTTSVNFWDDIFGSPTSNCPHIDPNKAGVNVCVSSSDKYTNNLMGGSFEYFWISEKQMGMMHRCLMVENMRKYVKDCGTSLDNPITVTGNDLWDFPFKTYSDVIVDQGVTLSLSCELEIPENAEILVKGTLIIKSGSIIKSACCNAKIHVIDNGHVIINDDGGLHVFDGLDLDIDDNGYVEVTTDGSFCVDDGSNVSIESTAQLTINGNNYNAWNAALYDINLPSTVNTGDYLAFNKITNNGTSVVNGTNTRFIASRQIILKDGFKATSSGSSQWIARIDNGMNNLCTPSDPCANGFMRKGNVKNISPTTLQLDSKRVENTIYSKKENHSFAPVVNFSVFPNPNNGVFTVNASNKENQTVLVYDIYGREIMQYEKVSFPMQIDLINFKTGVYFIHFLSNSNSEIKKILYE